MMMNRQGLALLVSPEIRATVEAQVHRARQEIYEAYGHLDTLSRESATLGQRLHREGCFGLAAPVTLATAVARQQVELALGTERYPGRGGVSGDGGAALGFLPTVEAADLLAQELHTLALVLAGASDAAPAAWSPPLWRCAGILQQVAAQLQEAVLATEGHHGAGH